MPFSLMNAIPLVAVILLLMTYRPRQKGGTAALRCPDCHEALPPLREPHGIQQMLWGGWTCGKCGRTGPHGPQDRAVADREIQAEGTGLEPATPCGAPHFQCGR
jgi:hypothetical protein